MTDALDGNAIAGQLYEAFGTEMTVAVGICTHCGARGVLAEAVVYLAGPGTIVRCRSCTGVLAVLVRRREITCVDLRGLKTLDPGAMDTRGRAQPCGRRTPRSGSSP
jgi:hypothetical protein